MYTEFFGFQERPFKLVPNPAYLFLGKSHQEAMAHLVYALHEGEGFVEITGEVGTGKTTLCRAFLENLDANVEAAYIFNPNLDSLELLRAINDEFGLDANADNAKDLIDALNQFLMAARSAGKTILLVIDEAQNLSREVLEQIRLLSNLETTQSKLLQIVLVGQPELRALLDSYELRQLRQRMTLSIGLEALTPDETRAYIEHRLKIASGRKQTWFNHGAIRTIHKYSRGIPRLINIACDRALLTAYGLSQRDINGKVARQAIGELRGKHRPPGSAPGRARVFNFGLTALIMVAVAGLLAGVTLSDRPSRVPSEAQVAAGSSTRDNPQPDRPQQSEIEAKDGRGAAKRQAVGSGSKDAAHVSIGNPAAVSEPAIEMKPVTVMEPETDQKPVPLMLGDILKDANFPLSRTEAFRTAMAFWNMETEMVAATAQLKDDYQFFHLAARQSGLMLYRVNNDLDLLEKLNLPAIMKFHAPEADETRFLVLSSLDENGFYFSFSSAEEERQARAGREDIAVYWTGEAYVPWNNVFSIDGEIPSDPPDDSLITLKLLLRDIGYGEIDLAPNYDAATRLAIMDVQQKNQLPVDGVVGSLTKIALYNAKGNLGIPSLKRNAY